MRFALAVIAYIWAATVAGWLLAFAFWLFTVVVLGETECDRGECGFWGELIDDHRWLFVFGFAAAVGLALWPWYRARIRRHSPVRG